MAGVKNLTITKGSTYNYTFAIKGPRVLQNASTTNASAIIGNILRTDILTVGMSVSGAGIPANAVIATIVDSNTVTISVNAIATQATVEILFSGHEFMDLSLVDFRSQIRTTHDSDIIQASWSFQKNINNTVTMSLTAAQASSLAGNTFVYDVEMFTAGDASVTQIFGGTITANNEVTRL